MSAAGMWFGGLQLAETATARKRGRGATPVIERTWIAPRANPSGRRVLRFRFRPLQRHCAPCCTTEHTESTEQTAARRAERGCASPGSVSVPSVASVVNPIYEVACNLIAEYFAAVGGFRLADDAVVTAWADALADYTPAEISAAIAAKAGSLTGAADADERRYKLGLRGQAETFPRRLDYWLDISGYAVPSRPLLDDALRARLYQIRRPTEATPGPARPAPEPARDRRALLGEHLAAAVHGMVQNRRILARLTERQRAGVARAVKQDFAGYVAAFDPDVDAAARLFAPLRAELEAREAVRRWGFTEDSKVPTAGA